MRLASNTAVLLAAALFHSAPLDGQSLQYLGRDLREYRSVPDTGPVARAQRALAATPRGLEELLQLGLAQSGIREFREAIATFTRGIESDPENALFLRWRGHRYLSVREFDRALLDLTAGLAIDSTLYGLWYHLGVLHFVRADFNTAAYAFSRAQPLAPDAGELAGSTDWLWMALVRTGRVAEAEAMLRRRPDSLVVDNAYARRLRLYRGELRPDQLIPKETTDGVQIATLSFGLGNWLLASGDTAGARRAFERSVATDGWPAFGFIAAEAELRRLRAVVSERAAGFVSTQSPPLIRADPCVRAISPERMRRVMVSAALVPAAGSSGNGLLAARAARLLQFARERIALDLGAAAASLPPAEPALDWLDIDGWLRLTLRRNGQATWEIAPVDSAHSSRGIALLAHALDEIRQEGGTTVDWPREATVEEVTYRITLSRPSLRGTEVNDDDGTTVTVPLFSLSVPHEEPVRVVRRPPIAYPYNSAVSLYQARVPTRFLVRADGTVDPGSVTADWPADLPRPEPKLAAQYEIFRSMVVKAIPRGRFSPAMIADCAVPQEIAWTFIFQIAR